MNLKRAFEHTRKNGLASAMGWAWYSFCERYFEWRLHIKTNERDIDAAAPTLVRGGRGGAPGCDGEDGESWTPYSGRQFPSADCKRYEPLPYMLICNALVALGNVRGEVLLDYGCGLGRVVLMAAQRPFARVVGVDIDAPLIAGAWMNAASMSMANKGSSAAYRAAFYCADAAHWSIPDDVSIIFLFNPFVGDVMESVQDQIRATYGRNPRRIRIVYAHALDQPDLFEGRKQFEHKGRVSTGAMAGMRIERYQVAD